MDLNIRTSKATDKKSREKKGGVVSSGFYKQTNAQVANEQIKALSYSNNIARVCIQIIKDVGLQVPWHITAKDGYDPSNFTGEIEFLDSLISQPNDNNDTYRSLFSRVIEDVLVFDRGVIEKVRNAKGEIVELYTVEGSTISSCYDNAGVLEDIAYKQYLNGSTTPAAEFEKDDLMLFVKNPQGGENIGKGKSPIEAIVHSVVLLVQASTYNAQFFNSAEIPPAVVNLQGAEYEQLKELQQGFQEQMKRNSHAMVWTNADSMDFQLVRPNNQDMQFMELYDKLIQIVVSAFGLSIQDVGLIQDVNRATAEVQASLSKHRGIKSMLSLIAEEINKDLVGDLAVYNSKFGALEFGYEAIDKADEKTQAEVYKIYAESGILTVDEIRKQLGYDSRSDQDLLNTAQRLDSIEKSLIKSTDFESSASRELTEDEAKVDFDLLKEVIEDAESQINSAFRSTLDTAEGDVVAQIVEAVKQESPKLAAKVQMLSAADLIFTVRDVLQGVQTQAVAEAKNELSASTQEVSTDVLSEATNIQAQKNTEYDTQKLNNELQNMAVIAVTSGYSEEQVGEGVRSTKEKFLNTTVQTGTAAMVLGTINRSRLSVFRQLNEGRESNPIIGFRYNAVMDSKTTEYCRSMDGKVFGLNDPKLPQITPPNHFRCRSILVPITAREAKALGITLEESPPRGFNTLPSFKDGDAFN